MAKPQSARNMKFTSLVAAALVAGSGSVLLAEPAVKPVSIDACIQMALQRNLDIRIARYLPDLTGTDLKGAYGAYDPTFSFEAGYDFDRSPGQRLAAGLISTAEETETQSFRAGLNGLLPTGTRYTLGGNVSRNNGLRDQDDPTITPFGSFGYFDYFGGASISITQPLLKNLWIDNTRWTIQLGKKALKQDQQSLRAQIITTVTDVLIAYYNLAAAREDVGVQEKALELADRSLSENKKRVEVGAMAPLEEKQAAAQVASRRADLLSAQQSYNIAQNTLKRLLTDDFAAMEETLEPVEKLVPTPYPFNRQDSWHKGLTLRPDIIQSQLELEKQQITLRFRKNQLYPQLDFTASYGVSGRSSRWPGNGTTGSSGDLFEQLRDRDNPNWGFGGVINIPLSNRSERYRYKASKLENERLLLRHKQLEQSIMVAIDNSILTAQSAFERVEATKQARIYAEQALDAEQKKLENGKSTSFVVLSLQSDLTQARSAELRTVADYYRALAVLHQDEGATLESLGVKVEFE
jgi:outer membrane protein TolC